MARRRHFGSVRKLPSGRHQASYWHEGERHLAPDTFVGKTEAQAWLSTKEIVTGTVTELATGDRSIGPPKTAAGQRSVAIPPNLLPVIERHLATVGPGPGTLLFRGSDGYLRRGHFYIRSGLQRCARPASSSASTTSVTPA